MTAHDNRTHYRRQFKAAHGLLEVAKRDHQAFGMYEDCGDSYQSRLDEATGSREAHDALRVSTEKFYKKLKAEFIEAFPECREALEALIPGALANVAD
jgi:hypothetical protein